MCEGVGKRGIHEEGDEVEDSRKIGANNGPKVNANVLIVMCS